MSGKKTKKPKPDRSFGWLQRDVFRLTQRAWDSLLRASGTGVTVPQSRILTELRMLDGLTQTALADMVLMEKAPLGRIIDRMEDLGLVERRADPADRRVRRVYLTEELDKLDDPLWDAAFGMFDMALAGFTEEEYETLVSMLNRIKANLEAALGEREDRDEDDTRQEESPPR